MSEFMEPELEEEQCACGGTCDCGGHHQQALTQEEYVSRLEQYLVDLKAEITSVEAELEQLRQVA